MRSQDCKPAHKSREEKPQKCLKSGIPVKGGALQIQMKPTLRCCPADNPKASRKAQLLTCLVIFMSTWTLGETSWSTELPTGTPSENTGISELCQNTDNTKSTQLQDKPSCKTSLWHQHWKNSNICRELSIPPAGTHASTGPCAFWYRPRVKQQTRVGKKSWHWGCVWLIREAGLRRLG